MTRLEAANSSAYEAGYQAAYAGYQDLSQRYIAELKKRLHGRTRPKSLP